MVIAIIAILAAILFPVFAKAREKARGASCLSNLKQHGLAAMQYAQDYDETLPRQDLQPSLWAVLSPYTKSDALLKCPSDTSETLSGISTTTRQSYAFNRGIVGTNTGRTPPEIAGALAPIKSPASVILIMEWQASDNGNRTFWEGDVRWMFNQNRESVGSKRHTGGGNWAFADGHVKWLKESAIDANSWGTGRAEPGKSAWLCYALDAS